MKQEVIRLNLAISQFHHKYTKKIELIERALPENNPYKAFLRRKVAVELDAEFEKILWRCHSRLYKSKIMKSVFISLSTTDLNNFLEII